jgi:pimeloyl-ACP methyl ester carboxylesterase
MVKRWFVVCAIVLVTLTQSPVRSAQQAETGADAISLRTAAVDGLNLQYLIAGHGPTIVLLHGYAETSRMWRPLIPRLASSFTVIAPDLPGIGGSAIPADGQDMTHAAARIHALVRQLGLGRGAVVGHDIGLMVAFAYAAQFPDDVDRLVLMDAFLPGVDGWEAIYNNPGIWHFRFNGPTPEALVKGRERTYFEHFWNNFAADRTRSLPEADRQAYATAYARPGRMRAAWAYFVSFQQAAEDFGRFAQTKLTMPVLSIGGEKANGATLARQVQIVATGARSVTLPNTGHWVMEESPQATMDALVSFLNTSTVATAAPAPGDQRSSRTPRSTIPEMRLTPDEVRANQTGTEQIGSSFLAGVSTKVLEGDAAPTGLKPGNGSHRRISTAPAASATRMIRTNSALRRPAASGDTRDSITLCLLRPSLEAVPHARCQRPRRDDVRSAEDRLDVIDAILVEGVQQIDLERDRRVVAVEIEAGREVPDRPGLDAVRIETRTAVDADERRGKGVVGIRGESGRVGVGH